ncbi:MAG TPA: hypothetical protein PKD63_02185 [Solirubrobacteraceae bacterium]|nr:hypothetical protein [Solirubrobacteraceae bacterium]
MTSRRVVAPLGIALIALAVCSAVAFAVHEGLPFRSQQPARAQAAAVTGSLTQSNSRDGAAILGASAMRPGDSVAGEVTIANTGDIPGAFRLGQAPIAEQPGTSGGRLSAKLLLQVLDVTNPAAPTTVWSGGLGMLGSRDLGTFPAGHARTYRFVATFPDEGPAADNAFAGASSTVEFLWTAASIDAPAAGAGTPTADTPPAAPTPSASRTTSVATSGALIRLTLPGACVPRGGVFRARLSWSRIKRKGNVFVKISRTDFYVNATRIRIDRKAPFVTNFRVPMSAAAGATLTVRARAHIKVRKGRAPKKSIHASVRVCR